MYPIKFHWNSARATGRGYWCIALFIKLFHAQTRHFARNRRQWLNRGNRLIHIFFYRDVRQDDNIGLSLVIRRFLLHHGVNRNIPIDAMMQKERADNETEAEIVILTHITVEKNVDQAIAAIE